MNQLFLLLFSSVIAFGADPLDAWTDVTTQTGTSNQFTTVTFGNGLFVAGTTTGKLYRSTDGVTWTLSQSGVTNNVTHLLYVHGRFFAISSQLLSSVDGIQWTSTGVADPQMDSVMYWLGNWYASGYAASIWKSTNLTDWTTISRLDANVPGGAGVSNDQTWVGYYFGTTVPPTFYGYYVMTANSAGATTFSGRYTPVYADGLFLCAESSSGTTYKASDGLTWSPVPNLSVTALGNDNSGLFNFDKVGSVSIVTGHNIFSSTDFSTWTPHPTAPALAQRHSLAAGNSFVMAVGSDNHLYRSQNFGPAAPMIVQDPFDLTVKVGGTISLSVSASGGDAATYQWRHNNNPIDGATSATLTINSASVTNSGTYDVVVSNPYGSVTSKPATVSVDFFAVNIYAGLTINGQIGQVYQIQARPAVGQNLQWTTVAEVTLTETNQIWYDRTTPTNSMQLFRAVFLR